MIKVALTGNIASGKSAVQKYIENLGYPVLDCDIVAHKILENSKEVIEAFGTNDRIELSKRVFSNKNELKKLEEIIHPKVSEEILSYFEKNIDKDLVFVAVPQLFEAGFDKIFDKIILVTAKEDIREFRLIKRNGYDRKYAKLRINSQMADIEKIPKSDFVIENNSSLEKLYSEVDDTIKSLKLL